MIGPLRRRPEPFTVALAAVTLVALLIRALHLAAEPGLGDDWRAALSAITYVERGEISGLMWQHPRLRDLLVYVSVLVFGETKLGVSLPSLALGVLSIPLIALLARRLAGPTAGLVAAVLVALDPLHVQFSRQAINDVYLFFFGAAGVLLALDHLASGRSRTLVLAGVAFGLGLASKWIVAAPMVVTALWLAVQQVRAAPPAERGARLALLAAALGALPIAIYLLTWVPWFAEGRDLVDWGRLQATMWREASVHQGFNPATRAFPSRAVLWFLFPVWWADFTSGPTGHVVYLAITNPFVWLATLPAAAFVAVRVRKEHRPEDTLMIALLAGTWLPFVVASRPIFLNAALAVLPFAVLPVSAAAAHLAGPGAPSRPRLAAYLGAVALAAIPLLLLATGAASRLPSFDAVFERFRPEARFEGGEPAPDRP